jgi:hypothetical protein
MATTKKVTADEATTAPTGHVAQVLLTQLYAAVREGMMPHVFLPYKRTEATPPSGR